ncbi:MAG: DUF92 domain-containing protein [Candidatus Diapherotrites archaeon]|nr:DUF92 domain-containing protein [Candidatus Diapherotrites archaeon]
MKKSLSFSGIMAGNLVGIIVFLFGGINYFITIVTFFLIAEIATSYSRKKIRKKHEQRTVAHVFGNSGAALLSLVFGFNAGFFGAIAVSLSDTLSSEIGMLSKKKPRLITTLGLSAAVIGSAIIAGIYFYSSIDKGFFGAIALAGFLGSIADSFLGAVFEKKKGLNNTQVNFLASLFGAMIAIFLTTL